MQIAPTPPTRDSAEGRCGRVGVGGSVWREGSSYTTARRSFLLSDRLDGSHGRLEVAGVANLATE
jgi:hypothetical protein